MSTDGGVALGDSEIVAGRSADGESNDSSSLDVVGGGPESDLDDTILLIAPLSLGSLPTGVTLRSRYERPGRKEDVNLLTDEVELLPRALKPKSYDFLSSDESEEISARLGSDNRRPAKLIKGLYDSLVPWRLDSQFIPLRRLYLRYAFMQLDKALREVIEIRGEYADIEESDLDLFFREWSNTC